MCSCCMQHKQSVCCMHGIAARECEAAFTQARAQSSKFSTCLTSCVQALSSRHKAAATLTRLALLCCFQCRHWRLNKWGNDFFFLSSSPTYADMIMSNLLLMSTVGRKLSHRLLMNLDSKSSSIYNHAQTVTEVLATCAMFYCAQIDMLKT